jgi:hypothetical protein
MQHTTRNNNFLSIADTVLWSGNLGAEEYKPATVIGIELFETPDTTSRDTVLIVKWSQVGNCFLQLDNGHSIPGSSIMPVAAQHSKQYIFPEPIRLN